MKHFDAVLNIFVLLAISCINATDQSKRHDDDSHITFSHTYGVCTVRKYGYLCAMFVILCMEEEQIPLVVLCTKNKPLTRLAKKKGTPSALLS